MNYVIGDVVLAYVPFEDGKGVKVRPALILNVNNEKGIYVIAECYSDKETYDRSKGVLIKETSQEYGEMGLDKETFITPSIKAIFERMVIKKLGFYSKIEAFKNRYRKK